MWSCGITYMYICTTGSRIGRKKTYDETLNRNHTKFCITILIPPWAYVGFAKTIFFGMFRWAGTTSPVKTKYLFGRVAFRARRSCRHHNSGRSQETSSHLGRQLRAFHRAHLYPVPSHTSRLSRVHTTVHFSQFP